MVPCSGFQSRRGSRCSSGRTPQALRAHGALSAFVQPPTCAPKFLTHSSPRAPVAPLVPPNYSLTAPSEPPILSCCPQCFLVAPLVAQNCSLTAPPELLWLQCCPVAPLVPPNSSLTAPSEPPVLSWGPQCCPVVPSVVLQPPLVPPHFSLTAPPAPPEPL